MAPAHRKLERTTFNMNVLAAEVDFNGAISDAVNDLVSFIPKLVLFLVILVAGTFVAKWIRRIVVALLKKVSFDSYIDKAGIGAHLERAGFADSGRFVAQLLYYLIMVLVLKLSLSSFGENAISTALDDLVAFIPKIIVACAIIIITGLVANAVGGMLRPGLSSVAAGDTVARIAVAAIWVIGVFAAIDQIEFAEDIVDTLFTAVVGSLSMILVIKFGVGGIWAARDHFWPAAYERIGGTKPVENAGASANEPTV